LYDPDGNLLGEVVNGKRNKTTPPPKTISPSPV